MKMQSAPKRIALVTAANKGIGFEEHRGTQAIPEGAAQIIRLARLSN